MPSEMAGFVPPAVPPMRPTTVVRVAASLTARMRQPIATQVAGTVKIISDPRSPYVRRTVTAVHHHGPVRCQLLRSTAALRPHWSTGYQPVRSNGDSWHDSQQPLPATADRGCYGYTSSTGTRPLISHSGGNPEVSLRTNPAGDATSMPQC